MISTEPPYVTDQALASIQAFQAQLSALAIPRTSYTVDEMARISGKSSYTVREWCRMGQVNAFKSGRCGASQVWRISAAEVGRYKNEGLLPIDPERNAVRSRRPTKCKT